MGIHRSHPTNPAQFGPAAPCLQLFPGDEFHGASRAPSVFCLIVAWVVFSVDPRHDRSGGPSRTSFAAVAV
jgi:hypothetical protein